jgi:Carboxypeptidase regulatory-like domain
LKVLTKTCYATLFSCLALVLFSTDAKAQISSSTGAIQGIVTDPQSAVIPGAHVTLTNVDTGTSSDMTSLNDGTFVFPLAPPGNYSIKVQAAGFETAEVTNLRVDVTKVTNAVVKMTIGQVSTVATVNEAAIEVDTHTATTGDVITGTQIRDIPLPTRNFLDLTAMQAGTAARIQSAATVGHGAPILDVAGSRATVNNFVLDGVDANNFGSNTLSGVPVPSPDAIAEFRVSTSMYDASQGRGSGGNINVVLRSGTDKFHGGAYEFYRSNDMNANDFFANLAGKPVPVLLQNQFGGEVGGPVPKVKDTFWFFSYQGTRQKNGVSSLISGSQPVLPGVRTAASLGAAFGVSPASIDPVAVNILNAKGPYGGLLYPSGTCAGVPTCTGPGSIGSLVISEPTIYNEDQEAVSVDRNLFRNNRISGQFFYANIYQYSPTGGNTLGQGMNSPAKNDHVAVTDTETFTPRLLNEFRVGFTNIKSIGEGVEGVSVGDIGMQKWDAATYPGIPSLSISGLLGFGGIGVNSYAHGGTTTITIGDTVSWTLGKHTVRLGIENRRYGWNYENDYGTRGSLSFPNFSSFLTGTPNRLQVDVGSFPRNYRAQDIAPFVQDDFHVTRRLTLNLGLRYDYLGFPYDTNGKVGNFDPSLVTPACVAAGGGNCVQAGFVSPATLKSTLATPGVSNTTLTSSNNTNFAPRIGAAYDLLGNGKIALRGGFGVYYIRTSGQTLLQLIASPPWVEQYLASGTAVVGSNVLANPWPAGLPQPSQFPILPVIGQFNGKFTAAGAPIFVNPDGSTAVSQSLYGFSRNLTTPYVEQYNFTVETQLPKGWILETGYIGSRGVKLLVEPSLNQSLLVNSSSPMTYNNSLIASAGFGNGYSVTQNSNANAPIRVPVPGFSAAGLNLVTNQGYSHYNGLVVEARHAFSKNFQFKMDYTFAKSTDDDSGPSGSDLDSFTGNQLAPALNRGISDFDLTHRFVFTGLWHLPGPKTGLLGETIGNWRLSGVWTIQSGLPFGISSTNGGGLAGLNGSVTIRANTGSCSTIKTPGSVNQNLNDYMNPACFAAVPNLPAGTVLSSFNPQQTNGTGSYVVGNNGVAGDSGVGSLFGAVGRNTLRGPGAERFDLALSKIFPIRKLGEQAGVEFRAEAFKVLNNPIFSNPAANISNPNFGTITSTVDSTGRILQLALKVNF